MTQDEQKRLLERIAQVLEVCNRIDRDLAQDRVDLQEFSIRVGNLETQFAQLRDVVNKMPAKVEDRMENVAGTLAEETKDLKEAIKEKKVFIIKKQFSWKFWR
jgi:chromosome segregation ATPase